MAPTSKDGLSRYYEKRQANETLEPYGGSPAARRRVFVVQKHAARRLHYDLRLELGGVLKSWAIPRGPSFNPAIKRLAVRTEDHPIDYVDFEGLIPEGNYGAGAMIVWDRGVWSPLENPETGLKSGKLLFELKGYKLRGVFTLVKTKGDKDEWLLIKKPDEWATPEGERPLAPESILSGLTVEDLKAGHTRLAEITARVAASGAPRRAVDFNDIKVMQAHTADEPFTAPGWLFELKYDGYRLLAEKRQGEVRLRYRSGKTATGAFPDLVRAIRALPFDDLIMDGEVVVLDEHGRPRFQRLQKRVQLSRTIDIERATVDYPGTMVVFDLLAFAGYDLRPLALATRKTILKDLLPSAGFLRFGDHIDARGEEFYAQIENMGLEGMVAKKADSPYRPGRTHDWLKVRVERSDDFVIVGYTEPKRDTRTGFSGLHLARFAGRDLVYAGGVGSGFDEKTLTELSARLSEDRIENGDAPCTGPIVRSPRDVWVHPRVVCEVRYLHRTDEGLLRHPVFVRVRDDKGIEDMMEPDPTPAFTETEGGLVEAAEDIRKVPFTNLDKVFWPEEGHTKGDLIAYYRAVAPWILPYLKDRPVVLTRYPDGIHGKNFFQKDAPPFIPGWVRTERMWSEHAQREIDYFVADDEETLLYVINLGSIPLHVWSSRVTTLQAPDWSILDLDPKGAPFSDVVRIARAIHALCEHLELPAFPKTSGASGLHVLIPLGRQCTYAQSRTLAELIARIIVQELPDIATIERHIPAREGRVYIDYLQNGHGRLLVSPLCVRPREGATVSTPLDWAEVGATLDPNRFTVQSVPARLKAQGRDPMLDVLTVQPDLVRALDLLGTRLRP